MSSRVLRYRFENNLGERQLQLPEGAEILEAGHFNGAVSLWVKAPEVEVGKSPAMELRRFLLVAVGQDFVADGRFVGVSIAAGHEILIFELEEHPSEELRDALRELETSEVLVALRQSINELADRVEESVDGLRTRLEALEGADAESLGHTDLERMIEGLQREVDAIKNAEAGR